MVGTELRAEALPVGRVRSRRSGQYSRIALTTMAWLVATGAAAAGGFLGPDGTPLPFRSDGEILEFLEEAEVISIEEVPVGINKPRKVLLERGGIRAHAIFRDVYKYQDVGERGFVDSYLSEIAAYKLARLLGLDRVAPVIRRRVKGSGSVQLWIEEAMTDAERRRQGIEPPDPVRFDRQLQVMHVFDNLIDNRDRNPGNILIDRDWKVWFIDHTRSFAGARELERAEEIRGCDRRLFERLRTVDRERVREELRPYARRYLADLFERWDRLVDLIQRRIREAGEEEVLFDLGGGPAAPGGTASRR